MSPVAFDNMTDSCRLAQRKQVLIGLHHLLQGFFGCLKGFVAEIQGAAVMGLEYEETHGHRAVSLFQERMGAVEQLAQGYEVAQ